MRKYEIKTILIVILILLTSSLMGQEKRAQAGMKFLSVANSARVSGMGEAVTAVESSSMAMFFNPAGMARQTNFVDITLGQTEWIADIKYMYGSASFAPFDGDYGIIGFSLTSVDYGKLNRTVRKGADGYEDLGTFSPTAISMGVGYAKALSDKFSVGGNIKYVRQSLGDHVTALDGSGGYSYENFETNVLAFDFGIIYRTGFRSLNFGMSIRNFSEEIKYIEESFQLPLTFKIGFSMNMSDLLEVDQETHSILVAVDASHPRDYDEQINIGLEYTLFNSVSFRAGYITPTDEQGINAGIGIKQSLMGVNFGFDYAYTDFGVFDNLHRFTVSFSY